MAESVLMMVITCDITEKCGVPVRILTRVLFCSLNRVWARATCRGWFTCEVIC